MTEQSADHGHRGGRRGGVMLFAADPLANFINRNPTVVMLALGFLLMIGVVLIADGFGVHVPKGYIYTAMAFSAAVETLNIWSRRARTRKSGRTRLFFLIRDAPGH